MLRVHEEVLVKFGLRSGDKVQRDTIDTLQSSEEFILAKHQALQILNRRLRSEKELRDMLRIREFHPHAINMVVTHLSEMGILDDEKFAKTFAHYILSRKPAGKALVQRELMLKGIERTLIDEVLAETFHEQDEEQLALTAAQKALKRYTFTRHTLDNRARQQKLSAFLSRRGFSWQTITATMRKLSGGTSYRSPDSAPFESEA